MNYRTLFPRWGILFSWLLFGGILAAQPNVSASEAVVNTTVDESQTRPAIAQADNGNVMIVWESFAQDGDDYGIYAQIYDSSGAVVASEFIVNDNNTTGSQRRPAVAYAGNSLFHVTWQSYEGGRYRIKTKAYTDSGTAAFTEVEVDNTTAGDNVLPKIAADASGNFVIVWAIEGNSDDGEFDIAYQMYNSTRQVSVSQDTVNDVTLGNQTHPDVAMASAGNFVVVFQSDTLDASGNGVYAETYDASGVTTLPTFQVNTTEAGNQQEPAVGMDDAGDFVVVWTGYDGTDFEIYGQVFQANGQLDGSEFVVNSSTSGHQDHADVAMNEKGGFVVNWTSYVSDANRTEVYQQTYNEGNGTDGGQLQINDRTADYQQLGRVVWNSSSLKAVHTWQSGLRSSTSTQDGSNYAVVYKAVSVEDTTAPTAVCQNITAYLDGSGSATITAADVDGGSSDNDGIASSTINTSSFSCSDIGVNVVTLTIADSAGNSDLCIAAVNVVDSTSPTAVCSNISVYLDGSGSATITAADLDGGSSDNCSISSTSASTTTFNCANAGSNSVTLTVTDPSSNTDSCTSTVTVLDSVTPTAVCTDLTVYLDGAGSATITGADVDGGSSDNCSITSYVLDSSSFDCNETGSNTVNLTVADGSGNSAMCSATVTVLDSVTPTAVCQDITVYLDGAGAASITAADVDGGSSDNCTFSTSINTSSFSCANTGANSVTLTVTDASNKSASCTSTVTVSDTTSPTAVCQNLTVYLDGSGAASITTGDVDGGSSDNCSSVSLSLDNSSFGCSNTGSNTVSLTATDGSGNMGMCSATITVIDSSGPTAVCQDLTVYLDGSGSATITGADVDGGSSDNCGISSTSLDSTNFDCNEVGANTVNLTVSDGSGSTASCSATVTVVDSSAPTAVCQDITVYLDGSGAASITAADVDGGSSDNCTFSAAINTSSFSCANTGSNSVTLTATDASNNSASCTATVTVADSTSPTAVCQDITVQLDGSGNATIAAADIDGGSSDNCSSVSLSASTTSFTCANVGSNSVTLTVTDGSNNSATCSANVTVEDTVSPTAVCQDLTVYLNGSGSATITTGDVDGGSSDNCSVASLSLDSTSFDCNEVGANTVNLTVSDGSGNMASCSATVTVVDSSAPTAVCQDITVYLDGSGAASITAADVDGGSSDNCTFSTAINTSNFSCANTGSNSVTLTATDASNNSASCTANVTVTDSTSPTAVCQDITVQLDGSGNATIVAADIDGGSSDNCSSVSLAASTTSFTCANIGSNNVTLTVTDGSNNSATCSANVTVEDVTAPTAVCQDITLYLNSNGSATITAADVDGGSTDNCSVASTSVDSTSFDCNETGANTVTLTATDGSGNSSTCTATVTVQDTIPPSAVCQDLTVYLDGSGAASITAADVDGGSSDNCTFSTAINTSSFSCANTGSNSVTLTVTDASNNVSTCTATVTVSDSTAPTAVCQDVTLQLDGSGNATIVAADIDGGSSDNCSSVSLAASTTSFTCANIGSNSVTLTVTDGSNNSATCSANVTVEDTTSPTAVCQDITLYLNSNGSATITAADVDGGSTDNCSVASTSVDSTSFDCNETGANTVTLTATDGSGNSSTCTATVTVQDTIPPSAVCQDLTVYLDGSGAASITAADVDGGSSDNCSFTTSIDSSAFSCANTGSNTVTLTATDPSGNASSCTGTVTVVDSTAPTAVCQNITIQLDGSGVASITAADVDGGSSDNCSTVSLAVDSTSFDCAELGTNTVNLTVTDGSNNSATCSATVTVEDTTSPAAVCQDVTIFLDGSGSASITASDVDGGSTDNCSIASTSVDSTSFDCNETGANTVILTVVDGSGNSDMCSATVTVQDSTPPTAVCQDISIFLDAAGSASIVASDVDGGSTDNCSVSSIAIDSSSFDCASLGAQSVVLTATDPSGNTDTCTATVTVLDTIAPSAVCNSITVALDSLGAASVSASDIDGGSGDNCSVASSSISVSSFGCGDLGANNVTLTVTDDSGNTDSCVAVVTVVDSIAPTVICLNDTVFLDSTGSASITSADLNGGSSDNCAVVADSLSQSSFGCADLGSVAVTLMVFDTSGNMGSCTGLVEVVDTIAPLAVCVDATIYLDANGDAFLLPSDVDGGSSDNCSVDSLTVTPDLFDCSDIDSHTSTLMVWDASGNMDSCIASISVEDTLAPEAVCLNPTVFLDANGMGQVTLADVDGGSTDNCGIDSLIFEDQLYDCDDVGVDSVTLTVVDDEGLVDSCMAVVTIADTSAPTAVCSQDTIFLDAMGTATLTGADIDGGSFDNCGIDTLIASPSSFSAADLGQNTVTLTVEDPSGNATSCTTIVVVEDTLIDSIEDEILGWMQFSVYPNPTPHNVELVFAGENLPIGEDVELMVVDMAGHVLLRRELRTQAHGIKERIDLGRYANGSYAVQLVYKGRILTRQVVKY